MTSASDFHLSDDDLRRIMDKVEEAKAQRTRIDRVLDKAAVAAEIDEIYTSLGEDLRPEVREEAVRKFFDELYSFDAPKKDFAHTLATAYVKRAKAKKPVIVTAVFAALAFVSVKGGSALYHQSKEHDVEVAAANALKSRDDLQQRITSVENSPVKKDLPKGESAQVDRILKAERARLAEQNLFFSQYCPKANCSEGITTDNYGAAFKGVAKAKTAFTLVAIDVQNAERFIEYQTTLNETGRSLDMILVEIEKISTRKVFRDRAQAQYTAGKAALNRREVFAATDWLKRLTGVLSETSEYVELEPKLEQIYKSIDAITKEDAARKQASDLYDEAKKHLNSADVSQLRIAVDKLRGVEASLSQEYKIIITGGKWRYPNNNLSIKNYYLIVHAMALDGKVFPQTVTNEENEKTETVNEWGERVPEHVYNRVGDDKKDDNIIQDNLFGTKERGYLTSKIDPRFSPMGGKITHW